MPNVEQKPGPFPRNQKRDRHRIKGRRRKRSPNYQMPLWLLVALAFVVIDLTDTRTPSTASPLASYRASVRDRSTQNDLNTGDVERAPVERASGERGSTETVVDDGLFQLFGTIPGVLSSASVSQGDRLSINGRMVEAPWFRQGESVYIPDMALVKHVGLDLGNTSDPSRQPVLWFSEDTTSLPALPTSFDGQFRYLNLADLVRQEGWALRTQSDVLSIDTQPSTILSVRHGRQTWGDRLVIDLDHPTPFQVDSQAGSVSIQIDGAVDSPPVPPSGGILPSLPLVGSAPTALLPLPDPDQSNTLSAVNLVSQGQQSTLQIGFSSQRQARVWTVSSPPRIIVDIHPGFMAEKAIHWLPGLWWRQRIVTLGGAQFPVISLEIDPDAPNMSLKPVWANPAAMPGTAPLATTARQWKAVAAINGGFFNRNNQLPLGAIRRDRQWSSGPILNRGIMAWNSLGDLHVGRLSLRESIRLASGQTFPSLHLNSGYVEAGLSRYTSAWGPSYTPLTDYETLITVRENRIVNKQLIESAGSGQVPIPPDGYVLAARSYRTAADAMPIGSTIQTEAASYPPEFEPYAQIVGAGPLLIQNRQIVLDARVEGFSDAFARQGAIRSAIATTSSGTILLVAVQQRVGGSGPTLSEMAHLLYQLGATNALNLDGGNSTSLYLGGQLINRPPSTVARVHNGIGVFIEPD